MVRLLRPTGIVRDLMDDALRERREHGDDLALGAYRAAYIGRLDGLGVDALQPEDAGDGMIRFSALCAGGMDEGPVIGVRDGDTLCCACSVAESRAGRCHRSWAAPFLARAGWNVILDGVPFVVPK